MAEEEKRKASDVILAIENDVKTLIKVVANYDFTLKLVLTRLENVNKKLDVILTDGEDAPEEPVQSHPKIEIDENPIGVRRTSRPEASPKAPQVAVPQTTGKKIPVFQSVVDNTGKIIFLADVEVITEDRTLVLKTRTTAAGKWQGSLNPGKYTVTIMKRETGNRKKLEYIKEFVVPTTDAPLELEAAKLV